MENREGHTFVGFFIFIGNVGRVPVFRAFLQSLIAGRDIYTTIIASQVISNVPAALICMNLLIR